MADTASDSNRFAPISPDNDSGSIWIATLLCLVYSLITILTRAWLRQKLYSVDDVLILLAFVQCPQYPKTDSADQALQLFQIGSAVSSMLALNHGLGQTLSLLNTSSVHSASTDTFTAQILFILAATAAKCSTLWLMMRLFNLSGRKTQTKHHGSPRLYLQICYGILAVMALWGILALITSSVNCQPSTFILSPDDAQCPSQSLRWHIISGADIATETLLILTAVAIVYPVHLAWHLKIQVIMAFIFRAPLIALSALRMLYVDRYTTSDNPGMAQAPILVLQHVYLAWTIISATAPLAKSFIKSFSSGFGIGINMDTYTSAYGSGKNSHQKSYELGSVAGAAAGAHHPNGNRNLASRDRTRFGSNNDDREDDMVTPIRSVRTGEGMMQTHALPHGGHGEKGSDGAGDAGSMESVRSDKHIIRKDMQWSVGYEPRAI